VCNKNVSIDFDLQYDKTFTKNAAFTGVMMVKEKIIGPMSLSMEASRCSLDMKNCEYFQTFNLKEMCKKYVDKNIVYRMVFDKISPPMKCPLAPGNYTMEKTEFNLGMIEFMPIDGYIYTTTIKMISGSGGSKKVVLCFKAETKITKVRV
jgi:hypothetical protein